MSNRRFEKNRQFGKLLPPPGKNAVTWYNGAKCRKDSQTLFHPMQKNTFIFTPENNMIQNCDRSPVRNVNNVINSGSGVRSHISTRRQQFG